MTAVLPDPSTRHLRSLVAGRTIADRREESLESIDPDEAAAARPSVNDVTGRVEASLAGILDRVAEFFGAQRAADVARPDEGRQPVVALVRHADGVALVAPADGDRRRRFVREVIGEGEDGEHGGADQVEHEIGA